MDRNKLIELIKELGGKKPSRAYELEHIQRYASYIVRLFVETDRQGKLKNPWIQKKTAEELAEYYARVAKDGLIFDGVHITLQSTGISYDYVAYKNKMLLVYPETKMDFALVYEGDEFEASNEIGSIMYRHKINNPFDQKADKIIGGYCVIRNERGEFITLLSSDDIDKHRKVAKTDYIWSAWFKEMALKTILKKAVKVHFSDIYENIEKNDNENYNLDNPLDIDIELKAQIDEIKTEQELNEFYQKNKGKGAGVDAYIATKKKELYENTQL